MTRTIHKLGNRVKCVGDTVARFLQNVTVFCNYSSQQVFILGWNAIGARMLNPGQNRERIFIIIVIMIITIERNVCEIWF